VIIALGESLLVTGATFATLEWNGVAFAAFVVALIGSVAMWWVVLRHRRRARQPRIRHSNDPASRPQRVHVPARADRRRHHRRAVADELLLAHPEHMTRQASR